MKKLSFIKGMLPVDGLDFSQVRASSQERVLEQFTPRDVAIPMQQHMGTPADPCVSIHDYVTIGQMIGRPTSLLSAPVHASISGTVTDISPIPLPSGIMSTAISIRNDIKRTMAPTVQKRPSPENLTPKDLQRLLLFSGVVGMGGEGYPASAKCQRAVRAGVHTMLVNGLQSEPYLNSDIHILRENTERVIKGAVALSGICKAKKIVFCLQDNCPQETIVLQEAVHRMQKLLPDRELSVMIFKSRFPQGYERLLIKAFYGIELQKQQNAEEAVGAVIFNVTTCASFWDMVDRNLPSTSRVISISGDSMIGHNVHVPIGTRVSEILERIPGISACNRIVIGGALTGAAIKDLQTPIIKTTTGITLIKKDNPQRTACIHCGACVEACPAGLIPYLCNRLIELSDTHALSYEHIDQCISCGACSYVCPSGLELSARITRAAYKARTGRSQT